MAENNKSSFGKKTKGRVFGKSRAAILRDAENPVPKEIKQLVYSLDGEGSRLFTRQDFKKFLLHCLRNLDTLRIEDLQLDLFEWAFRGIPRAKGCLHPSDFSRFDEVCERKGFLDLVTQPSDKSFNGITYNNNSLQRIFDLGNLLHMYFQMNIRAAGYLLEHEGDVSDIAHGIEGHADGVMSIKNPKTQSNSLLEIKTMRCEGFYRLEEPKKEHIKQASIYAENKGCDKILFIYCNKNDSQIKYFFTDVDFEYVREFQRVAKKLVGKANAIRNIAEVEDETRVKAVTDIVKNMPRVCKYTKDRRAVECPYKDFCFKH